MMHVAVCPLVVVTLLLAGCGLILIRQGIGPRRVGQTPHCRRCEYNLTGLTGERCPECGTELSPLTIVYGERHASRIRAWAGSLLLVPLLVLAGLLLYNVNWFQFRPASWLMKDLASSSLLTRNRAWAELTRRDKAGSLSASQRSDLVDVCLQEQAKPTSGVARGELLDYLGACVLKGQVSAAQKETFYGQFLSVGLAARSRVAANDPVPYKIRTFSRGPSSNFWVGHETAHPAIDDQAPPSGMGGSGRFSGHGAGGSSSGTLISRTPLSPGVHKLRARVKAQVYAGPFGDTSASTLEREYDFPLEASFEVLPAGMENDIKLIQDASLGRSLEASIAVKRVELVLAPRRELKAHVSFQKLPAGVAFDVILREEGREYPLGNVHLAKDGSTDWGLGWQPPAERAISPFTICDVIFRSNPRVARETVDLTEIWNGELVYKDVKVEITPPPTTSPASAETAPAGP